MLPTIAPYALPTGADLPDNRVEWGHDVPRTALLIHDMEQYFMDAFGPSSPMMDSVVGNIARIREEATAAGVPVYYTAQPPNQNPDDRGLLTDFWGPGLQDDGRDAVVDALAPSPQDTVLTKWRYDAFVRSEFQEMLAAQGRTQLIITGVYAHIGCMTTALSAFMRDIKPFVVADAVADFSREKHLGALEFTASRCGRVVETSSVLGALQDDARTTVAVR